MPFDAQRAWTRLGAHVASKPNHGRHDLLVAMATIADEETIPEDDFQRALRLTLPAFAEVLFDRTQALLASAPAVTAPADQPGHAIPGERPTIAA